MIENIETIGWRILKMKKVKITKDHWKFLDGAWTCKVDDFDKRYHRDKRMFKCPSCELDIKNHQFIGTDKEDITEVYKHDCGEEFRVIKKF
jgi:hypothetical protein